MKQFGEHIRQLREQNNLLQRQVANQLDIDTPMLSKIERGERSAKREQIKILSELFEINEDDLLSLWLADKVYNLVKDEPTALKALSETERELRNKMK